MAAAAVNGGRTGSDITHFEENSYELGFEGAEVLRLLEKSIFLKAPEPLPPSVPAPERTLPSGCQAGSVRQIALTTRCPLSRGIVRERRESFQRKLRNRKLK